MFHAFSRKGGKGTQDPRLMQGRDVLWHYDDYDVRWTSMAAGYQSPRKSGKQKNLGWADVRPSQIEGKNGAVYKLDGEFDLPWISVYSNNDKVFINFAGELSADAAGQVATHLDRTRRLKYRKAIDMLLKKYNGREIDVTGHSNGAMNLIDMLADGDLDGTAADFFVMNSPAVRDDAWMKKINSYLTRKPDSVKFVMSEFDFGLGTTFGGVNKPFP